ncbi:MAG: alpha-hydroxy-acid oxidizing protein [Rhizobiaceae bacterium]|nr:alpha-hydroxy-acid oxidizing protein [Rhizobiaceae bacterium]
MQHQYGTIVATLSRYYNAYPSVADLMEPARRRIPFFAWEYLDSGTGAERLPAHNLQRLQEVEMVPQFMGGASNINLETRLMGETYAMPIAIGPIGMTGMIWPGGEHILARTAARQNIPYCLSTVACEAPESVGPLCEGKGWFQLYVPADQKICADMMQRAWDSGFRTLMVTADVPVPSTRERQRKAGLKMPLEVDYKTLLRVAARPTWALATLRYGKPRLRMLEKYAESGDLKEVSSFLGRQLSEVLNLDYMKFIREQWKGKLVVKGILHEEDAKSLVKIGVDGIVISNHGGRQFDGAPAAIDVLPAISKAVNKKCAVLYDSGIRTGLDVLRALALGADFVLLGRAFIYGIAALGEEGGDHVAGLLKEDMANNLKQLGVQGLDELPGCLSQKPNSNYPG